MDEGVWNVKSPKKNITPSGLNAYSTSLEGTSFVTFEGQK
ncbi:hypothetical protein LV85_01362 [Algoriphagus chordae]|uniref:Uncharacterized protein n=1 Tax=Algoriphagus chordae TaxID=237019 RepID=A0A2W7QZP9_9BACT|nr:hypothetical protein LV85_01362 [Algoriphagus chordae]